MYFYKVTKNVCNKYILFQFEIHDILNKNYYIYYTSNKKISKEYTNPIILYTYDTDFIIAFSLRKKHEHICFPKNINNSEGFLELIKNHNSFNIILLPLKDDKDCNVFIVSKHTKIKTLRWSGLKVMCEY